MDFVLGDIAACRHPSCPFSLERVKRLIQLQGWLPDKTQKTPEMVLYPMNVPGLMTGLGSGCQCDEPSTFQS
jgi:hypothetical protein